MLASCDLFQRRPCIFQEGNAKAHSAWVIHTQSMGAKLTRLQLCMVLWSANEDPSFWATGQLKIWIMHFGNGKMGGNPDS